MRKPSPQGKRHQRDQASRASRLNREDRRDVLLDAVIELVTSGHADDVSMDTVAERASVSRPLVYKHFANRGELLAAAYRREAETLYAEMAAEVGAAETLEDMYRALLRGALRAAAERDHVFAALRAAGGWSREVRAEQRSRDRQTVRAFSARASRQYHLDRKKATVVSAVLLGAIDSILASWRHRPTVENADLLEDVYMSMVSGAYASIGAGEPLGTPC